MEVGGLPLHPLIVHAAVGIVPLAALFALLTALVPGWRWFTRWGALVAALGAVGFLVAARRPRLQGGAVDLRLIRLALLALVIGSVCWRYAGRHKL